MENKTDKGYFIVSRSLFKSPIMNKPPEYLTVWLYLISKAAFKDNGRLKRGQGIVTLAELSELLSYNIGYRKVTPSKKKVWGILEFLRNPYEGYYEGNDKGTMIVTAKVTNGILYTICKYEVYQNPESYEGNSESNYEIPTKELRREQQGNTNIKKNDKERNNKENIYVQKFDLFYSKYPKKQNKQAAKKSFLKIKPDDDLFNKMMDALESFKMSDDWTRDNGQFIPMPSTWLNNRRWEDDLDVEIKQSETYKPEEDDEPQFESEEQRQQQIEFMSRLLRGGGIEL